MTDRNRSVPTVRTWLRAGAAAAAKPEVAASAVTQYSWADED